MVVDPLLFSLLLAFFAMLVAGLGTHWLMVSKLRFTQLDHPNERSLHSQPTPHGGGVAILLALGVTWPCALAYGELPPGLLWLIAGGLLVAAVSWLDDQRSLPPLMRIAAQSLAAILLLMSGLIPQNIALFSLGSLSLQGLALVLPFLFLLWMMNLYNFMDGMDGFAGGMAFFGFLSLAYSGYHAGYEIYGLLSLLVAAANLGFLGWNFPPARIFMGDVGSITLGFLVGAFALWGIQAELFPFWFPVLVFSPFIVDATVTLLVRLYRRERIWQAHRQHYYQRLVCLGWDHRQVVLLEYLLMMATSLSALLLRTQTPTLQLLGLVLWCLLYVLLGAWVHYLLRVSSSQERSQ